MDLTKYGNTERRVIKAFERRLFEKNGIRSTCRSLVKKHGGSDVTYKGTYALMKKYGAFENLFPDRFKVAMVSYATRLKTDNLKALQRMKDEGKGSIVNNINIAIEEFLSNKGS